MEKDEKITDSTDMSPMNQESVQDQPELSKEEEKETNQSEVDDAEDPTLEVVEVKTEVEPEVMVDATVDETADVEEEETQEVDDDHESDTDPLANLHLEDADKNEIYEALKQFASSEDMRLVDRALKEIKPFYDKRHNTQKEAALKSYLGEEGTDEADFQFKGDDTDSSFFLLFNTLRDKKQKYFSQLSRDKESNLKRKNEILDLIRDLADGEETNSSIGEMKRLQTEWKSLGQVPSQYAKTLWANYNALIDRFYDNRSIYFELKELDRKKNLEAKQELCQKAEALENLDNLKNAIFQLNELHEEFKHIGPVPKDVQEELWERFKTASDKVYSKRKDFFDEMKSKMTENVATKMAIGNEAETFVSFNSDKISDWNKKTKQILELQKKWDAIGGLPKEKAKEVNKHFWGSFKKFFANKSEFFKKLEAEREGNLEKKQALLNRAIDLKESTVWDKAANELKKLQMDWREIGPVPEKHRNDIYQKFKSACDAFFERKRSEGSGQNSEYIDNLNKKGEICSMLEAYLNSDDIALDEVYGLLDRYSDVGFVPKESIDSIHERFDGIMAKLLGFEELTDAQRTELEMKIQVNKLKNSPHGAQKLIRKESSIRRRISELQSEISTWQTNMDFFAASKNADKLKDEMVGKMDKAEEEIRELKNQLEVFKNL